MQDICCRAFGHGLAFTGDTRSRPPGAWTRSAPGAARAVAACPGATGLSRGELAVSQSAGIDRAACGTARGQGEGVRRRYRRRAASFRRPQHGSHRRAQGARDFSAAKTRSSGSARAPKSRCSAGGPGTTALRAASRGRDRTLLASRQLREQARASSGSRLRCHRGVVGPRCLTCIDAPARPTRSLDSSQPAHAPAAPPHARASGALFARRLLCPRRIDAGES